jgi:ketosteroid isomerase-like protein
MRASNLEQKRAAAVEFVRRLSNVEFSDLPIADDFTIWTPVNGTITRPQYETAARTVASLAPDGLIFNIEGSTAEGDRVAVEASCHSRLRNGALYDQHYHFLFEFKGGQIHRLRTHLDTKMVADVVVPALSAQDVAGLKLKDT